MNTRSKNILIRAGPHTVFSYMDRIGNTGMHMTKSSMSMMGSRLHLEQLSPNANGLGSSYRWYGRVLGLQLDFTVIVTQWEMDRMKIWETSGKAKMLIMSWYRMRLKLSPVGEMHTKAELQIEYEKPRNIFLRLVAFALAPWYANWCLKNMLGDCKRMLERTDEDEIKLASA